MDEALGECSRLREEERESLELIFGEDKVMEVGDDYCTFTYWWSYEKDTPFRFFIEGGRELGYVLTSGTFETKFLFGLSEDYPLRSTPTLIEISPPWLPKLMLNEIQRDIKEIFEGSQGEATLFQLGQYLNYLNFENLLDKQQQQQQNGQVYFPFFELGLITFEYLGLNIIDYVQPKSELPSTCNICFTEYLGRDMIDLMDCDHSFCRGCMSYICNLHIKEKTVRSLKCPDPGCPEYIRHDVVKELVDTNAYEEYDKLMFIQAINNIENLVHCPNIKCGCPIIYNRKLESLTCIYCQYNFCLKCFGIYHGSGPCPVYMSVNQQESETLKYLSSNCRYCPGCSEVIEKNMGCDHMYCTKCHLHFNWSQAKFFARKNAKEKAVAFSNSNTPRPLTVNTPTLAKRTNLIKNQQIHNEKLKSKDEFSKPCPRCRLTRPRNLATTDQVYCLGCQTGFCFYCGDNLGMSNSGSHLFQKYCRKRSSNSNH